MMDESRTDLAAWASFDAWLAADAPAIFTAAQVIACRGEIEARADRSVAGPPSCMPGDDGDLCLTWREGATMFGADIARGGTVERWAYDLHRHAYIEGGRRER